MNRFLRSQYPPNPRDLAVFDTTTGSSSGRTLVGNAASSWRKVAAVLFAFFMVGVAFSQTVTVVTPTGGTALGNTNGTGADPVCRYFNSIRYQVHYTAAELTAAGVAPNAVISKIAWNVTESSSSLANYTVKMANTTQANGNAHNAVATTTVKNPFTYAVALGFNDIILDVPFTWDGTSNLLVEICSGTTNPFTTPYGGVQARTGYATSSYGARAYRVDGASACGTNTSSPLTNKPVIRLTWTGAAPCAGTPAPGNTLASANPVCAGANFNLTLQNATSGTGVTYQWYSSTDGVSYAPVAGATSAGLTTNVSVATYFYCAVTCSGNTGNSTPVNVTINPFLNCYCSSNATTTFDEEITNVTIGTLNQSSTCTVAAPGPGSVLNRYANYKSGAGAPAAPDFIRGSSVAGTVTVGSCGTFNYTSGLAIFIDLNQDGDYADAGEKVYSNGAAFDINCVPATVKAVSLNIPATATLGLTTMRVINAESNSGNAITSCFNFGYGETEDYMVNIVLPPPPPTISGLSAVGGCAGQGSVVITGANFAGVTSVSFASAPAPGNLVVNLAPTATNGGFIDEVSWTLTNSLGAVIGSGGPYGTVPVSIPIGNAANGPYSLFIETQGAFADNEVIYDVTCNGTSVLSGIQAANTTATYSVATCNGAPGAGVNATYTVNSTTQITANIPATATTGTITVTTAAGSGSSVSFDVYALPTATVTGGTTICSGAAGATLSATGAANVVWSPSAGLSATTGSTVTATPTATTTYTATLTDGNGCTASGTTTVTVNQTPAAPTVTPANPTVCAGSTVDLSASSSSGSVTVTAGSTSALAINDNQTTTNTIAVAGVSGTVNAISVTINGTHTWASDVTLTLTAPNGSSITLIANEGGSADNFTNMVFSSAATTSIVGAAAPFTGTWLPEVGVFSSLYSTPNGNWVLSANDNAGGDTGSISAWSITISASETLTYSWFDSFSSPAGSTATITTPTLYYNEYYSVQVATPSCTSPLTFVPILVEEVSGIVLTPINVTCNGFNNGSFSQTQTCGTAPFSYVVVTAGGVNTGAYTPGIPTNLAPGTYDVYLQDANLFTNTIPVSLTITEPAPVPVVLEPTGSSVCVGATTGNVSALSGILIPGSTTVSSGAISIVVPDANATGSTATLNVTSVPAGATTTGVSVTWNMTHTWDSDMQFRLIGPDGTNVDLCLNNGGSGDNFVNTTVSSSATNVIGSAGNNTAPFTGTFGAEEDMTQLFGNGNGTWTLSMIDQFGGDIGTLTDWSITLNYLEPSGSVVWYDAASGGNLLGTGNTFNLVGTSVCASPAVAGTYTAYAFSTDGTCLSTGTPVTLTVGTPMAVAIDGMPGSNANCTYSIGLSDAFGDGWNGNTATVLVDGTPVLSGITLASGAGPQFFNFSVSAGQTISVVYTVAGGFSWPEENSYVVYDGADGAGAAVYTAAAQTGGPTSPATVPNNCGSSTVCPGTQVTLTANVTGGGQPYTYAWSTGETTPSITVAASSTPVGLTVTDACGTVVAATDAVFSLYAVPTPVISGYNGIPVNDAVNAFQTASGAYNGGQWNVTGIDPGTTFQWTYGNSAAGPWITIAGATANPQTLIATGAAGTVYLLANVTTTNGCVAASAPFQVVLNNLYDSPCSAGTITVGNQGGFVYSNAASGVDAGEVAPPATGCSTQNGWCNSTLNNTIWFTFVAPASGHVSINATGFDSQFAVYSATNCADYSTYTLVAANDDQNGLAAGLTNLQCLTPGATYYLQVDGYGAPGTFTITLTDLGNTAPEIYNVPANQTVNAGTIPPMAGSLTTSLGAASVAGGGSQTLSGVIPALPVGATVTSTQVVVNGVTAAGGTWVADMTVAVSGAVTLGATTLGGDFGVVNGGPYSQTTTNPGAAGGAVDVTLVDTYAFGNFTANSVNIVVNYTTPASNSNTCDAIVVWNAPFIQDDQPSGLVVTQSHNSGDTFPVGTTTVTYTATDCAGLVTTASFTVTVVDVTAPTATADADVTVDAAVGACTATVTLNNPTATDNCGVASITNNAPAAFPIGTTTVTWTVTDVNNNTTTVTQNVTVNVNAGSVEICDNADNDCDSQIDEGLTFVDYYADADGDGYGAGTATNACSQPAGYVTNNTDCNDASASVNPAATEVCNSIDDNCDSQIDEGLTFVNYYADADGDTYGAGTAVSACSQPAGYVTNNTDCNDASASVNPAATEVCNSTDDNCNAQIDEGLTFTNYYVDTDGDGYGAGTAVSACSQPAGYVTSNTDCNNSVASVNPGASEVCGNAYDDDCDGTVNEGCPTNLPGENPSNAISMATSVWPNCFSNVNSTLAGMAPSASAQTVCLTGEDKWYQFVATSEGVSILVNSTQNDILIELQTAAGVLVAQENAIAGVGNEILNHYGLTAGQVYKVGIRNYNSALGIGTFSACVRMLKRGGCDYGPGPYSLCQYFKATWAGSSGTQYRFTFTGTSGLANGNVYTKTQNSDICVLSTVTPTLPYGSSYNVLITNIFTLQDAAGNNEVLEVPALAPCTMNTIAEPVSQLRSTDNCAAGPRFRSAVVASLPWSCGAVNWRWEFIEVDGSNNPVGLPIYHLRGAASNYLNLGTVAALQYGKTYAVRTCPIFTYTGTNYNWGPVQYMCIIGQSGMIAEGANAQAGDDARGAQDLSQNLNVYPNPTNGSDINIQLSNITSDNVQVRVLDAMGRVVFANRYSVDGMFTTNMTFDRPLANGLYMIEASFNGEVLTQRMMVQK